MYRKLWLLPILVAVLFSVFGGAVPAHADFDDPLFIYRPLRPEDAEAPHIPPPAGYFEGPCGIAVDSKGNFYVADYHHHTIDVFGPSLAYGGQIAKVDALDGPCSMTLDSSDVLYVNNYHRNVTKFPSFPMDASLGTIFTGDGVDSEHPTGLAINQTSGDVYVNQRYHLQKFSSEGVSLGTIGAGKLGDSYGLAVSGFPATDGYVYAPDAGSNSIKVFNPAVSTVNPIDEIDGVDTPDGGFNSLVDSAIAVDKATGEIYVADNLQPEYTERPETVIHIFDSSGAYEGRLKYNIVNAWPPGLAVDNSGTKTQSRVYVTHENSERSAIFAYPAGAATDAARPAIPMPTQRTGEIEEEELGEELDLLSTAVVGPTVGVASLAAPAADRPAPAQRVKKRRAANRRKKAQRGKGRSAKTGAAATRGGRR